MPEPLSSLTGRLTYNTHISSYKMVMAALCTVEQDPHRPFFWLQIIAAEQGNQTRQFQALCSRVSQSNAMWICGGTNKRMQCRPKADTALLAARVCAGTSERKCDIPPARPPPRGPPPSRPRPPLPPRPPGCAQSAILQSSGR